MDPRCLSGLHPVITEHIADLLVRNSTEWVNLGYFSGFGLVEPLTIQSIIKSKMSIGTYTLKELCLELLRELGRVPLLNFLDALAVLGLNNLYTKIKPLISHIAVQMIIYLGNFANLKTIHNNSHVLLFPNLDDDQIAKIASKMKMEPTQTAAEDILGSDKTVCLTIHWLETTKTDVKTTIVLVNTHGSIEKAWPVFLRQFGKPPNISIVQFSEEDRNFISIPESVATTASKMQMSSVDEFLADYWRNISGKSGCATHESHTEISIEKNMIADPLLENILQHVGGVDDKVVFKVGAKDKEYMIDQVACFLQCWTASETGVKTSHTVIAQMTFDEQHADQQITIPTNEKGHVILSKFSAEDSTVVIFATTVENYWRLWIDYPDIKSSYEDQGWTLTSMTPVSKKFVDELRELADVPGDLVDTLFFFLDDLEPNQINLANYLNAELLNTKIRGTTLFRHLGSNSHKELAAKDVEMALDKAWPKEDWNTKPAKLQALLNYFNIEPSDKTHNGLNEAWTNAKKELRALNELEVLVLTEKPASAWYCDWLWTVIKKSAKLKTIVMPKKIEVPNVLIINSLKQIPDYITLEFHYLDVNTKVIIDSLVNKKIIIKNIIAGPVQLPDPKRNRISVDVVQFVDEDTSIFESVIKLYPESRPSVTFPAALVNHTSTILDMCRRVNSAPPGARSPIPAEWILPNFEVGLEYQFAEVFARAYPLIPKPITVRSIINYFDTVQGGDMEFQVVYDDISENWIPLSVESVESAIELKKYLIVQDLETKKQVNSDHIFVVQNKLMITCSSGKFYSIKRQVMGFAPSAEIIVPTFHHKLPGLIYPDMSQQNTRQPFLERGKILNPSHNTPLCYFCKAPLQNNFDLIHIVPWAKFQWNSEFDILPVHSHCNTSKNEHLFAVVLQPKSFSFPLAIRTLALETLCPAVLHYIDAAYDRLDSKYDNLAVTTVIKMEELEYHMEDDDWRKVSDTMLNLLLTTYEYDIINKSQVNVDREISPKNFGGTYLGQDIFIRAIPAKEILKELLWLKVVKFPSIVQFLGYYYEDQNTAHLVFEKMAYNLSAIKLADLKKEVRWKIAKQVCAAMSFLHSKDVTHRGLKQSNILLDDQYNAKLSFSSDKNVRTLTGNTAPEIIENGSVTKSSDVYAFGILLLELASMKSAWEGRSDKQITDTIKNGWFPESLRKFNMQSELCLLIAECLAKDPAQRPSFVKIQEVLHKNKVAETFL